MFYFLYGFKMLYTFQSTLLGDIKNYNFLNLWL
jgi:hypothetical protein